MKKSTPPSPQQSPLPLEGPSLLDLLLIGLKLAAAIGIALALALWVNHLLAQI